MRWEKEKGKHNLGYQQLSPFCKKQLWELRARSANSNNVVRNILWPETNLTHRVDRCRGMHDTFSKGEVLALPFHLRNSDSQQPQQVEMNSFQDTAQVVLTDLLPSDSKSIDTLGDISNSMNQCTVPQRLIEHVLVH